MKNLLPLFFSFLLSNFSFSQKSALHFDGVNDYVPITGTTKLNSMSKITLETWMYVTNFNSSPCADCAPIIWNQQNSYRFGTGNTQKVHFSILNGTTAVTLSSSSTLTANTWHHIAATFNGTKLKLYIDGIGTDSATYSAFSITYASTSADVWIVDPVTGYGGVLEETRIWDYARTPAQILEGTDKRYPSAQPGLVLQLSYEDGTPYANNTSVTTIADKTTFGHNGTPGNMALKDSTSNFVLGRSYCDTIAPSAYSITRCVRYQLPSKKKTVTVSGVYQDTIPSWRGCDSVMTITVKILKASTASVALFGCDSVQNPISKGYFKKSGKYTTIITNYLGCDSTISYFVTIYGKDTTKLNYDACDFVVLGNGKTVTSSGTYVDSFSGFRGCDSFVIHNITIRKSTFAKAADLRMCQFVICPTNSSIVFRKPGTYYDTIPNKIGCDSVIEYTVISNATSATVNVSSCGVYKSPSQKYNWSVSGTYYDTLLMSNSKACDSFMTIHLTIISATKDTQDITECKSYTVPSGSKIITSSGTVFDAIKTVNGCDSIQYTLNVTINNANTDFNKSGNTLTATTAVSGAVFQWLDCDNQYAEIPGETNKTFTPSKDGKYALEVTENNCTDTSTCYNFIHVGTEDLIFNNISIFPNPTKGAIAIQSDIVLHQVRITLTNSLGETLKVWEMDEMRNAHLNANFPAALNLIRIESREGSVVKYILFE